MADRAYTVTAQNQLKELRNGNLIDVYEIHYAGPNGITGWIRTPTSTASPELVDELIRAKLATQMAIDGLGVVPQG